MKCFSWNAKKFNCSVLGRKNITINMSEEIYALLEMEIVGLMYCTFHLNLVTFIEVCSVDIICSFSSCNYRVIDIMLQY